MTEEVFDAEALERGRVFFAHPVRFLMGAVAMDGLPPADLPEVAFAGRSNVGKSSLINAVTGRTHLARASTAPGRTRELNFFVADEQMRLVDLPGYGFAKVSRGEKNKFQNLGRAFLRGRPNLKRAYLLIDSRHGLKDVDLEAMEAFDLAAVSYQIVLTKADQVKKAELEKTMEETQATLRKHPAAFPEILVTSSRDGDGMTELRAAMMRLLNERS